ncbi:hypothetical protein HPP92_016409 [Vanilla planifolia]|uniref:Uncharacterized protein n=1 Tax=Vanilla planifolia TaxID=51239 RepID=A0A835US23_VANPL|nr:hypothetical protein HPP92_016409 [Vanilla planifolia]
MQVLRWLWTDIWERMLGSRTVITETRWLGEVQISREKRMDESTSADPRKFTWMGDAGRENKEEEHRSLDLDDDEEHRGRRTKLRKGRIETARGDDDRRKPPGIGSTGALDLVLEDVVVISLSLQKKKGI